MGVESSTADSTEGSSRGRAAMGLDSDSDEDALVETPMDTDKNASARRRKDATLRAELKTISFRGLELTVKARDKGRGLAVPLEGDTLSAILKHMREQVDTRETP